MGIKTTSSGEKSGKNKEKSTRKLFPKISLFLHRGKSNLLVYQNSTKSSKRKQRAKQVMKTAAVEIYLKYCSKWGSFCKSLSILWMTKKLDFSNILTLSSTSFSFSNFVENFSKIGYFIPFLWKSDSRRFCQLFRWPPHSWFDCFLGLMSCLFWVFLKSFRCKLNIPNFDDFWLFLSEKFSGPPERWKSVCDHEKLMIPTLYNP